MPSSIPAPDRTRRRFAGALLAAVFASHGFARAAGRVHRIGCFGHGAKPRGLAAALAGLGYVEGENLQWELRNVPEDPAQLDRAAADMVRSGADVLVTTGYDPVSALSRATRTIPIVSGGISDPVGAGVAKSIRRPGMNVTGLSFGLPEAAALRLGTLHALIPRLARVTFMISAVDADARLAPEHAAAAAQAGIAADVVRVDDAGHADRIFASMRPASHAAWIAPMTARIPPAQLAATAMRHRIATHAMEAEQVSAGMLLSYWLAHSQPNQRIAAVVDRILRGADPAEIPFELPDKSDFALNRATARAIGVAVPQAILLRATEVIG